ncbi:MAG: phosphatase PAP2 family protein [Rhodococcus sp. (in: high G+C Gram-positive bacteria)]|uniref:phosphatase PAP2 family protein n=1 Tax=Rhodococcus sp. TaxID=1831 RepID=UPI003BB17A25
MIERIATVNESQLDGTVYTDVVTFAQNTHWLNAPMVDYSSFGMALFAVFILIAWRTARRGGPAAMAAAIAVPIAAVAAYLVNDGIKWVVTEQRPCYLFPNSFLLEACPPAADYSFPSNHSAVAAAMAVALFLIDRRLGLFAAAAAVVMGFSRVYVGAHYPHDVLVGLLVGTVVGVATVAAVGRYGTPLVEKLASGRLRPLLAAR